MSNYKFLTLMVFGLKSMYLEEQAKTPNYSSLEIVHHSWHVAFGKKMLTSLRSQWMTWCERSPLCLVYLIFGTPISPYNRGLDQMELLLCPMHRHHDLVVVARVVDKHTLELHDQVPHL